jgi:hypothetical protein
MSAATRCLPIGETDGTIGAFNRRGYPAASVTHEFFRKVSRC